MQFYQYWLVIFIVIFVIISIVNITKMLILVSDKKYVQAKKDDSLNQGIRNLLISIGILMIVSLIFIIMSFSNQIN